MEEGRKEEREEGRKGRSKRPPSRQGLPLRQIIKKMMDVKTWSLARQGEGEHELPRITIRGEGSQGHREGWVTPFTQPHLLNMYSLPWRGDDFWGPVFFYLIILFVCFYLTLSSVFVNVIHTDDGRVIAEFADKTQLGEFGNLRVRQSSVGLMYTFITVKCTRNAPWRNSK